MTHDPLGWKDAVKCAIASPHLSQFDKDCVDHNGRAAAFHLAVSLGKCRLFNVDLGDTDGTLCVEIAIAAAKQWQSYLNLSAQEFDNLHYSEDDPLETATDILFTRMDFWAAFLAIDEAYQEAIETKVPAGELRTIVGSCLDLLKEFDDLLRKNARFFLPVTKTNLFNNWKTLLGSDYEIPWWINPR